MPRFPILFPLLLMAGCAAGGPEPAPEIAARMPAQVFDLHRRTDESSEAGMGEGLVARYASPNGNRVSLYLKPDPALALLADGARSPALEPHLQDANRALGRELLRRGEVPGLARVQAQARQPGEEVVCILAPVSTPPSLEAACLTVLARQLATARVTVGGIRGTGRDRTVYAAHVAVHLLHALRRAAPSGGVIPVAGGARREESSPPFPEEREPDAAPPGRG